MALDKLDTLGLVLVKPQTLVLQLLYRSAAKSLSFNRNTLSLHCKEIAMVDNITIVNQLLTINYNKFLSIFENFIELNRNEGNSEIFFEQSSKKYASTVQFDMFNLFLYLTFLIIFSNFIDFDIISHYLNNSKAQSDH